MKLTIELDDPQDIANVISALSGAAPAPAASRAITEPAPKATATKPKAAVKAEEPAAGDDDSPTLQDAIDAATALVSAGKAAQVKAALGEVGAKRVSELDESNIPSFLAALNGA